MDQHISPFAADQEFEFGLSSQELADIVENKMWSNDLAPNAAYEKLSEQNKQALVHLVKAADILDRVFLRQDHEDNIRAKELLEREAAHGDIDAQHALTIFTLHNGLEGPDMYAPKTIPLRLFKNKELQGGKGFYPSGVTKEELVDYVVAHPEQASALLSNNTMVTREGNRFVATPYSVFFRSEMEGAARELLAAARETDHAGFAEYLRYQAQAIVNDSDPAIVYKADKLWIDLEDAPLEFTYERESYLDILSGEVAIDPQAAEVLAANNIVTKRKDFIGARVGIVNRESYEKIALYRDHLAVFNETMPLIELYRAQAKEMGQRKMTFADIDEVHLSGHYAAVRGGVTAAQNLPNDDKLGYEYGNRLGFHRKIRQTLGPTENQFLDLIIDPEQRSWYDQTATFLFTIGHEFAHSLGPSLTLDGRLIGTALGKWSSTLEENKADLTSMVYADYLQSKGLLTTEQVNKIYLTWIARQLPTKQPAEHESHRSRQIMQLNYFREKGALILEKDGKLRIIPDKMAATAREMLTSVLSLQLKGDPFEAGKFAEKYTAWNDGLQYAANLRNSLKPKKYRIMRQSLRDKLRQQYLWLSPAA